MTPAETDGIARLITHTARMNLQVEQGRSGRSHDERGFTPIIDGYKARWSGLSKAQQKAAIDYAKEIHDMTPALVKAAVETLED
jgi:hypothetical protein